MKQRIALAVLLIITGIVLVDQKTNAQVREPDYPVSLGRALSFYMSEDIDRLPAFKDFERIELKKLRGEDVHNPRRDGNNKVWIGGRVSTKHNSFKFDKAFVRIIRVRDEEYYRDVEFTTREVNGISYRFVGAFTEKLAQDREHGPYIDLRGTLVKLKKGREVARALLSFYEAAEL